MQEAFELSLAMPQGAADALMEVINFLHLRLFDNIVETKITLGTNLRISDVQTEFLLG